VIKSGVAGTRHAKVAAHAILHVISTIILTTM